MCGRSDGSSNSLACMSGWVLKKVRTKQFRIHHETGCLLSNKDWFSVRWSASVGTASHHDVAMPAPRGICLPGHRCLVWQVGGNVTLLTWHRCEQLLYRFLKHAKKLLLLLLLFSNSHLFLKLSLLLFIRLLLHLYGFFFFTSDNHRLQPQSGKTLHFSTLYIPFYDTTVSVLGTTGNVFTISTMSYSELFSITGLPAYRGCYSHIFNEGGRYFSNTWIHRQIPAPQTGLSESLLLYLVNEKP